MDEGLAQLLSRRRLLDLWKRCSIHGEALGGGGDEHRVAGESLAARSIVGTGVCFSHLIGGGCWSSNRVLVTADSLSFALSAPGILGGPRSGFGSRSRDFDEKLGNFTSLVMTHFVSRPVPDKYFHPNSISGRLMMPKSVSRPGRAPNGQGSLWADPICHGG